MRQMSRVLLAALLVMLPWPGTAAQEQGVIAHLPEPLTNNGVASLIIDGSQRLYSFSGLGPGKTYRDITSAAYEFNMAAKTWRRLPDVPGGKDRLASVAVGLGGRIYIFGGYTVAKDGSEVSTPEVFVYDPVANRYDPLAPMPVPVDDTVALAYQDRYIYLVSGWHDDGNVNLVQIFDISSNSWREATPFPGIPVFGHAGGIIGNCLYVADGVGVLGEDDNGRRFGIINDVWEGCIDARDPAKISWRDLGPHPGSGKYRMAAAAGTDRIIFLGGSDNPYNFNGIGYNDVPSEPSAEVFSYDLGRDEFLVLGTRLIATMDHRGLIKIGTCYITVGGMTAGQLVSDKVIAFTIDGEEKNDQTRDRVSCGF